MFGEIFKLGEKKLKQINKTSAKKHYDNGEVIYLHPCKMRVNNVWQQPYDIKKFEDTTFESVVNNFTYYNCNNEMGNYAHFFIEV